MEYTILQMSKLSGVSTRTIRYYEEVGLLKPAGRTDSDYRQYTEKEVDVLQQILFYRELGLKLSDIKKTMQDANYDRKEALAEHLQELEAQKERLTAVIDTVRKTILKEEGKITMTDQEKFEGLKSKLIKENEEQYGTEVREKYGEDNVAKSNAKMMNLTAAEYDDMMNIDRELNTLLKECAKAGTSPDSEQGRKAYELHKKWLCFTWHKYTKEAHIGVTEMYLADERFKAYYDKETDGCARFLKEAVAIYA